MNFEFIESELGKFVEIVTKRCDASVVNITNYISTENMLPDRQGVTISSGIPNAKNFISFEKGDTLFSNIRTYFKKVWFATFDGGASPDVLVFRTSQKKLTNEYLSLILSSDDFIDYSHLTSKGAKMPRGDKGAMLNYKIKVPPLNYQSKCSKLIFTLNKKIDNNKHINQTLEQMAQALFKSWFVDFEPVKAKIAVLEVGGSQEDAALAAMTAISGKDADALAVFELESPEKYAELKATAELFPSAMQDSELGEIPEGWDINNIKSLSLALSKGTTPAKRDLNPEENQSVNFLKVKDIGDDGRINISNLDKISQRVHEGILKRSILQSNDILFSIAGTIGRVAVVANEMLDCNCNQAIAFIRLKERSSHLNLIKLNLQSKRIQQEVESKVVQGVQANLSLTNLGELNVILPSKSVLIAFNNVITPLWEKQLSITKNIKWLTQLRDTLLPKLLSGEITLPEVEQAIGEVEDV
ncbi:MULTISPECIES: restriction endonuclease subunit S [Serratia]|uniref:restriction endonuclease subunit S n=1 Tax=Serratia TaxID=613 RepID=UPI000EFAF92C|nr:MULTISPECIES: restriction endonuclease subunit S [Serratia]MBH2799560.1 restriction endonuclease subunit S [Serratia ureilytica]MBH2819458.1 restriction endonuclease subunit S [Serratia ureilytica]MBH2963197.1 restriction endonuclease subunit S [Serratia ureilytica]MBH3119134.1 restriction endonuclease subunit S [Serratia ureilytica]